MNNHIISGGRKVSYTDLQARVLKIARGLYEAGIREKDTVAMMLRNDHPFFETSFAAGTLGAYSVPINWHYTVEEMRYILQDCDAKVLVIHADLLRQIKKAVTENIQVLVVQTPQEIQEAYHLDASLCSVESGNLEWYGWMESFAPLGEPPKTAPSTMIYTSGTTGHPKGVRRHTPSAEVAELTLEVRKRCWGVQPHSVALVTGPLYHSAPNAFGMTAARVGADIVLQPRFDAEELLHMVEQYKITHMHVVPTMFSRLLKLPQEVRERYDVSSLEFVVHGAAPCPPALKQTMMDWWGPIIHEYYGGTESGVVVLSSPEDWLKHPGTVGKVCPWAKLEVIGDDGNPVPPGEVGELYVVVDYQPDFTYHKKDEKRREIERDGLITIGDKGYVTEDGYVFLSDRKNDMVISGGVNIYPAEIEKELILLKGVKDCAVFGIPNEEFGEELMAYVELEEGAFLNEGEVKSFLKERMAGYKVPKTIQFHKNLPREDSGKIFKRKLRAPYWENVGRQI